MAGWGPGKEGTQYGHPTQRQDNTTHTQRQDRDGMKKCYGGDGWAGGENWGPHSPPALNHG
jgi:hypothetical protein